jgi:hypothetical protein
MYFAFGEKTRASTGRWVFRKRLPLLRFHGRQLHLLGRDAKVEPWRQLGDVHVLSAIVQQLSDDLLRPGRPGLGIGANDDVVVPELEIIPDCGNHMVIMNLAGLRRPPD